MVDSCCLHCFAYMDDGGTHSMDLLHIPTLLRVVLLVRISLYLGHDAARDRLCAQVLCPRMQLDFLDRTGGNRLGRDGDWVLGRALFAPEPHRRNHSPSPSAQTDTGYDYHGRFPLPRSNRRVPICCVEQWYTQEVPSVHGAYGACPSHGLFSSRDHHLGRVHLLDACATTYIAS